MTKFVYLFAFIFSLNAHAVPSITSIEPDSTGSRLYVVGTDLSDTAANNKLIFPGSTSQIQAISVIGNRAIFPIPDGTTSGKLTLITPSGTSPQSAATLRMINNRITCEAAGMRYIKYSSLTGCFFKGNFSDQAGDVMIIDGYGSTGAQTGFMVMSGNMISPTRSANTITINGWFQVNNVADQAGYFYVDSVSQNHDTFIVNGEVYIGGIFHNDGTTTVSKTFSLFSTGKVLNSNGTFTINLTGKVDFNNASPGVFINNSTLTNSGAIFLSSLNTGIVNNSNSTFSNLENANISITNGAGVGLKNATGGTFTNAGTININNTGTASTGIINDGTITNQGKGVINNSVASGVTGITNIGIINNYGKYTGAAPKPTGCSPASRSCPGG